MKIILQRLFETQDTTFGVLHGLPKTIYTLEDAWRGNERNISCIPAGEYVCKPRGWEDNSPFKFLRTWEVHDVPNRSAILIHSGNTHYNTKGCILVGTGISISRNTAMVTSSRDAMSELRERIGEHEFELEVKNYAN